MVPLKSTPLPGLWAQLVLLWRLRLTLARGTIGTGPRALGAILGIGTLTGISILAALLSHSLFASPALAEDETLRRFLLLLTSFLAGTLWVTWPVITAGVDDGAELTRFALFPVSHGRLFSASVIAGLVEARTWPIWATLAGAAWATHESLGTSAFAAALATLLLGACGVTWGRAALHLLLNVLQNRRSAEAMGGGLLAMLGLAALVPPPDLSWVRAVAASGAGQMSLELVMGGIVLFTLLPTGGWAWALELDAAGRPLASALAMSYLAITALIGYVVALKLLERFHRKAARALPQESPPSRPSRAPGRGGLLRVMVERELRDVLQNPRVRVMLALPFFLAILLKLVGARALALEMTGAVGDAWLLGGLGSYGALVVGAGLGQNAFGYDGGGATLLLMSPVETRRILLAKNLAHGGLAAMLSLLVTLFAALYVGRPPAWVAALVLPNLLFQTLLLLAVGNGLSVRFPQRFHASLRRHDRPAPVVVGLGLCAAAIATAPMAWLLRDAPDAGPSTAALIAFWICPVIAGLAWWSSNFLAATALDRERAAVLRAVARG